MDDMRFNRPMVSNTEEEKEKGGGVRQKTTKPRVFFVLILLIIMILVGVAVNFYLKSKKLESAMQTTSVSSANEIQKIIAEVGKLIVLPKNEEPTVATISDPEKLRDQPFFANAKSGDKVLIYTKTQKAILYDPINKIIVEVAPLNVTEPPK